MAGVSIGDSHPGRPRVPEVRVRDVHRRQVGHRPDIGPGVGHRGGNDGRGGEVVHGILELRVGHRPVRRPGDRAVLVRDPALSPVRRGHGEARPDREVRVGGVGDGAVVHVADPDLDGGGDHIGDRPGEAPAHVAHVGGRGGDQRGRREVVRGILELHGGGGAGGGPGGGLGGAPPPRPPPGGGGEGGEGLAPGGGVRGGGGGGGG